MESRRDTHGGHPEGCLLLSIQRLELFTAPTPQRWQSLLQWQPPGICPALGIRLQPRRKSPRPILSAAETWEAPAVGLTHQPRRPALDSGSAGRRAQSASARAQPEGLLWGRASGTPACGRWRSLPPTQGPCRPGPHGRGAAWSSLGRTSIARLPPCGVEAPAGLPVPGTVRAEPSSEQSSSHPGPRCSWRGCPPARAQRAPPPARFCTLQPHLGSPVRSLCSFFTTCGLTSSPEPTGRPPSTGEALRCGSPTKAQQETQS